LFAATAAFFNRICCQAEMERLTPRRANAVPLSDYSQGATFLLTDSLLIWLICSGGYQRSDLAKARCSSSSKPKLPQRHGCGVSWLHVRDRRCRYPQGTGSSRWSTIRRLLFGLPVRARRRNWVRRRPALMEARRAWTHQACNHLKTAAWQHQLSAAETPTPMSQSLPSRNA
jgi:hypothetical protein